jgi:two-component system, NarL family, nitrate/nitrite response regulator NarL
MPHTSTIHLVIADDHTLFRDAVRQLLSVEADVRVVGEASDGEEAAERCGRLKPDVLLLDVSMPRLSGIEALARIRTLSPGTAVVLLTAHIDRPDLFEALLLGVRGVILKSAETDGLLECVRSVAAGGYWFEQGTVGNLVATLRPPNGLSSLPRPTSEPAFTQREREIMSAVVDGASNAEISRSFGLRDQTIKNHLTRIFDKAGVSTRVGLALYALHHGMGRSAADVGRSGVSAPRELELMRV